MFPPRSKLVVRKYIYRFHTVDLYLRFYHLFLTNAIGIYNFFSMSYWVRHSLKYTYFIHILNTFCTLRPFPDGLYWQTPSHGIQQNTKSPTKSIYVTFSILPLFLESFKIFPLYYKLHLSLYLKFPSC